MGTRERCVFFCHYVSSHDFDSVRAYIQLHVCRYHSNYNGISTLVLEFGMLPIYDGSELFLEDYALSWPPSRTSTRRHLLSGRSVSADIGIDTSTSSISCHFLHLNTLD